MAPLLLFARDDVLSPPRQTHWDGSWKHDLPTDGYVLESWSQGFLVGALVMMMSVTVANMTKALLHRLILVEVYHPLFVLPANHNVLFVALQLLASIARH